jgi:hypothetical protein
VVYTTLQVAVTTLPSRFAGLVAILFGLATLSYTRHPEGFLDFLGARVQQAIARRRTRHLGSGPPATGPAGGVDRVPVALGGAVAPAGEVAG